MNVEIKLADPRACEDCPCMSRGYYESTCNLAYWEDEAEVYAWRHKTTGQIQRERPNPGAVGNEWELVYQRPQKCIEEHGE